MAVDVLKLRGSVEIDIGRAEASLRKIDSEAARVRDKLSRSASIGFDSRALSAITAEGVRARGVFERFGEGANASLAKFRNGLKLTGNSLSVVRETVESMSSEIIESFGVDGDVANTLANSLNKVSLSAIAVGGAIAGVVIGVGALTVAMAGAGAEIKNVSVLTGLTTDQVQKFESAATAAGVKTNTFTDAIKDLRDRAREAMRGNLEIAQSFQLLGVSAQTSTQNATPAFEALLNVLSKVPDVQQRITIAQRVLGQATDDQILGIVALTDANGALLNQVNQLGAAIDQKAVAELARMDREMDTLKATAKSFATGAGLQLLKLLGDVRFVTVGSSDGLSHFSSATTEAARAQSAAAGPISSTTGAIQNQTSAIMQLSAELASVRLEGINTAVDQTIKQIAFNSRSATEALASFKREKLLNDDFFAGVNKLDQVKKNLEAIDEARNPKKRSSAGPRTARGPLSELQQLQKQLAEINKDISSFQSFNSKEFGLRMDLEAGRAFKAQLDQIVTLRRALGEPIRAPFPATAGGAEKEIQRLNALKSVTELLAKSDPMAAIRESAQASTQALSATFTELDRLVKDALPQTTARTTEQALAQNELYQALLQTNPALAEYFRQQAQAADATIRATQATEAFKGLQESLNNQLQSFNALSSEQRTALELQGEAYRSLTDAQREQLLDLARQVDAQGAYRRQVEESQRTMEQFADVTRGLFDTLFEQGPKKFFEQLLSTVKRTLARIAADIATSALMRLFGGGAAGAAGGGGGGLGAIFGGLLGGGGGGGFLTGGFAGGNPAAAAMGGGGGGSLFGGVLSKIPFLGKFFGGGARSIGGLPTITRPDVFNPALGGGGGGGAAAGGFGASMASLGASGLMMGGGLLGSMAGGKSGIGRLLGGLGGTLLGGAAAGSGMFGGAMAGMMPALFSNPITAIIGGALIGGAFLARWLSGGVLRSLKKLVRGEYGIEVKSDKVLENIKALGESKFGKAFKKRQLETIRLSEVRELLSEYAERTGQKGNSKLFSRGQLSDPYNPANRFAVPRANGGPVVAGHPYIVGERRAELFVPNTSGMIHPNIAGGRGIVPTPAAGSAEYARMMGLLQDLAEVLGGLRGMPGDHFVVQTLTRNPEAAMRAVETSFSRRSQSSERVRDLMSKR